MEFNKKKVLFDKKIIKLPWKKWRAVEISPDGIHTSKGVISPSEIELLQWKASFYDRGKRVSERFDELYGKPEDLT